MFYAGLRYSWTHEAILNRGDAHAVQPKNGVLRDGFLGVLGWTTTWPIKGCLLRGERQGRVG